MADRDGNGWTRCGRDHRHWGRHGGAGLLVCAPDQDGEPNVLLVRRARWGQHGGTWAPPGGARDSHESPAQAAVREAAEECGTSGDPARIHGLLRDDHGGWSYQTLLATAPAPFPVRAASAEVAEAAWIPAAGVASLPLHPAFATAWPVLAGALEPVTLIVDGANVMGSRADGWWRDRAAAMVRLHADLARLAAHGVARLPADADGAGLDRWYPQVVLVVEGEARAALERVAGTAGLRAVAAPGEGDEMIADLAARLAGRRVVVTADQELRRRCLAAQAAVTGPRWLLRQL